MSTKKCEYRFMSQPSSCLCCVICLEVAEDPRQHEACGKLFCGQCIEKNGNKPCPNCREEDPQYFRDRKSYGEIRDLHVRCENTERGCDWEGTIRTLEDHVTTCPHALVPCPNKCETGDFITRQDLCNHLSTVCTNRCYLCEYCGKEASYASITEEHYDVCELKIVTCPNAGCTVSIARGLSRQHVESVCEYTKVACLYEKIGCEVRKPRNEIVQHEEDTGAHLFLSLKKMVELLSENHTLKDKVSCLETEISSMKTAVSSLCSEVSKLRKVCSTIRSDVLQFKVTDYTTKKQDNEEFYSLPFYTCSYGYNLCVKVNVNGAGKGFGTHVSVFIKFLEGRHDDELQWPFTGSVTFELLNQLANKRHHKMSISYGSEQCGQPDSSHLWGKPLFIQHSKLQYSAIGVTHYLKDDTLIFRVHVEEDKPWLACTKHD